MRVKPCRRDAIQSDFIVSGQREPAFIPPHETGLRFQLRNSKSVRQRGNNKEVCISVKSGCLVAGYSAKSFHPPASAIVLAFRMMFTRAELTAKPLGAR